MKALLILVIRTVDSLEVHVASSADAVEGIHPSKTHVGQLTLSTVGDSRSRDSGTGASQWGNILGVSIGGNRGDDVGLGSKIGLVESQAVLGSLASSGPIGIISSGGTPEHRDELERGVKTVGWPSPVVAPGDFGTALEHVGPISIVVVKTTLASGGVDADGGKSCGQSNLRGGVHVGCLVKMVCGE